MRLPPPNDDPDGYLPPAVRRTAARNACEDGAPVADLRIERGPSALGPASITPDQRRGEGGEPRREPRDHHDSGQAPGVEELAVALREPGRSRLVARLESDDSGEMRVRIVDPERNETVAVLTPDELRALAAQTGLPAGLLLQARS